MYLSEPDTNCYCSLISSTTTPRAHCQGFQGPGVLSLVPSPGPLGGLEIPRQVPSLLHREHVSILYTSVYLCCQQLK